MNDDRTMTVSVGLLVDIEKLLTRHQAGGRYDVYAEPILAELDRLLNQEIFRVLDEPRDSGLTAEEFARMPEDWQERNRAQLAEGEVWPPEPRIKPGTINLGGISDEQILADAISPEVAKDLREGAWEEDKGTTDEVESEK